MDDLFEEKVYITKTVNSIIDALEPLLVEKAKSGDDGISDFVASMFVAIVRLCLDVEIEKEYAIDLFEQLWDASIEEEMEIKEPKILN